MSMRTQLEIRPCSKKQPAYIELCPLVMTVGVQFQSHVVHYKKKKNMRAEPKTSGKDRTMGSMAENNLHRGVE